MGLASLAVVATAGWHALSWWFQADPLEEAVRFGSRALVRQGRRAVRLLSGLALEAAATWECGLAVLILYVSTVYAAGRRLVVRFRQWSMVRGPGDPGVTSEPPRGQEERMALVGASAPGGLPASAGPPAGGGNAPAAAAPMAVQAQPHSALVGRFVLLQRGAEWGEVLVMPTPL